ncbi:Rrf2 family transcriptional regulator [Parvibaculaceae bacterium PLY_AMNH_Bact1]|nr:Rrf2 family transcriptional regulator [Parvibaculaceae bacterium PLY_AMNH_Bact1]
MKKDGRLSGILHIILHLAEAKEPVTSERLARTMNTNPVVVRRVMASLRGRGFVASTKGHGGGWRLSCDLEATSLRDIYDALGAPDCIALTHRNEAPSCLVEQTVNAALGDAFAEAEALLLRHFEHTTLAELSADFHTRFTALQNRKKETSLD